MLDHYMILMLSIITKNNTFYNFKILKKNIDNFIINCCRFKKVNNYSGMVMIVGIKTLYEELYTHVNIFYLPLYFNEINIIYIKNISDLYPIKELLNIIFNIDYIKSSIQLNLTKRRIVKLYILDEINLIMAIIFFLKLNIYCMVIESKFYNNVYKVCTIFKDKQFIDFFCFTKSRKALFIILKKESYNDSNKIIFKHHVI